MTKLEKLVFGKVMEHLGSGNFEEDMAVIGFKIDPTDVGFQEGRQRVEDVETGEKILIQVYVKTV